MADRAIRHQDCDINAIFATARQDVRAIDFKRMSLAAIGGDAVKAWRNRSNQACGCGAPQCRQGAANVSPLWRTRRLSRSCRPFRQAKNLFKKEIMLFL
jgi:hypothetical protein